LVIQTLGLDANKVKPAGPNSVFICFRSQKAKEDGAKVLDNFMWKNRLLRTTDAKPAKDPLMLKRKQLSDNATKNKIPKFATMEELKEDLKEKLNEVTSPYWKVPYDEQVNQKL
jgi:hypothetical protein